MGDDEWTARVRTRHATGRTGEEDLALREIRCCEEHAARVFGNAARPAVIKASLAHIHAKEAALLAACDATAALTRLPSSKASQIMDAAGVSQSLSYRIGAFCTGFMETCGNYDMYTKTGEPKLAEQTLAHAAESLAFWTRPL